jgi:hypothetical protein
VNRVVAHFADGRIVKGFVNDFIPAKDSFHIAVNGAPVGAMAMEIRRDDLKALFFVKDFQGDPQHDDCKTFDPLRPSVGRRIKVVFRDDEVLVGTTQGYQPGRPGLFLEPADRKSNTLRCYIVSNSTKEITFI